MQQYSSELGFKFKFKYIFIHIAPFMKKTVQGDVLSVVTYSQFDIKGGIVVLGSN